MIFNIEQWFRLNEGGSSSLAEKTGMLSTVLANCESLITCKAYEPRGRSTRR